MSEEKPFSIQQTNRDGVEHIEFSSPSHNSLTGQGLMSLAKAIEDCGGKQSAKLIVLKSGGRRTFCAGADFDEMLAVSNMEQAVEFFSGFAALFMSMLACPKIILTQVQGKAVGGALGIIAASDVSFAAGAGAIKLSELNVGIGPFVVSPVIERKIGKGSLACLAFSPNRFFDAGWGEKRGLFAEVLDTFELLEERVSEKAKELLSYNPEALAQIKNATRPDLKAFSALLESRKKITAGLLLSDFAQNRIRQLKRRTFEAQKESE